MQSTELEEFKQILDKHEINKTWDYWIRYKDFSSRKIEELFHLSTTEDALNKFFQQWMDEFWSIANAIRNSLESVNYSIKTKIHQ